MKVKLNHLYYYVNPDNEAYFIRICAVTVSHNVDDCRRVKYYNVKLKKKGHNDFSKIRVDCVFNSPEHTLRELTKSERARALLLGL